MKRLDIVYKPEELTSIAFTQPTSFKEDLIKLATPKCEIHPNQKQE